MRTRTYGYDNADRLVKVTAPDGIVQNTYTYDRKGRVIKTVDASGCETRYRYNLAGWLLEKRVLLRKDGQEGNTEYSSNGNVGQKSEYNSESSVEQSLKYDTKADAEQTAAYNSNVIT